MNPINHACRCALLSLLAVIPAAQAQSGSDAIEEATALIQQEVALIEATAQLNEVKRKVAARECPPALIADLERMLSLQDIQQSLLPENLKQKDSIEIASVHAKLGELYETTGDTGKRDQHKSRAIAERVKVEASAAQVEDAKSPTPDSVTVCRPALKE